MKSELSEKTERITRMLNAENLGGVLINAQHNFAWLTGGKTSGINLSLENGACFLLIRNDGQRFILSNNIEMPRFLTEQISAEDYEPVEFSWQNEKAAGDFVIEKAKSLLGNDALLASDLLLNSKIRSIENLISACRYELTAPEIERYRQIGKDAGIALGNVIKIINPGETELEIAAKIRSELEKYNFYSVVTLVGADERINNYRHPVPTSNVWKKTVLLVTCARREGLIVSLSRLVCLGAVPDELQRKTEKTAYVFSRLLSATRENATGSELYQTAADAYAQAGFPDEINLHHQGGASGYKSRDWAAHPKSGEKVFANQAYAWNPSITGTKTEETALLTENNIEIISATPGFPQISVEIEGKEYLSPGILSL